MESLAPALSLTLHLRFDLQQGIALYDSLQNFCSEHDSDFSVFLKMWLYRYQNDQSSIEELENLSSYAKNLFNLIEEGLEGVPIFEKLGVLQFLMIEECKRNLDQAMILLPFKGLAPLMLLMFPSLFILLLSPIIKEFLEVFN